MSLQLDIRFRLSGETFSVTQHFPSLFYAVRTETGFIKTDSEPDPSTSDPYSLFRSLFIYDLFNDAANFSNKTTSNDMIVTE
jgi:hypothetical protein